MEKYYKISETRLKELLKAELELDQLNADGVDNWIWHGEGREEFLLDVIGDRVSKEEIPEDVDFDFVVELDIKNYEEIITKEEESNNTLKKCPFCGGKAEIGNAADNIFWVKCKKCGAESSVESSKKNAILKWNKRI